MNRNAPAIEHTSRREVWKALDKIKNSVQYMEWALNKEPDGIVPWTIIDTLSKATIDFVYASGHLNAIRLARDREDSSVQLPVDPSLPGGG